jgi:hypothetical protein
VAPLPVCAAARRYQERHNERVRVVRWALIPVGVIVVILLAVGAFGLHLLRAAQPTVRTALPALNRAVADVLAAAGPHVAVAVGGLVRVETCRAPWWTTGAQYARGSDLYVTPGQEGALLTRLAQRLTAEDLSVRHVASPGSSAGALAGGTGPGSAVTLSVQPLGAGWLRVSAQTGCRRQATVGLFDAPLDGTGRAHLDTIFQQLHVTPGGWHTYQLTCPEGGDAVTVAAESAPHTATAPLTGLAATADPADVVDSRTDRLVLRSGDTSTVVGVSDDDDRYTAEYTTGCAS